MIAHDKCLHFIGGVLLFAVFHLVSVPVGLAVVTVAAIGKEIYDWFNKDKHTPDLMDAVWTIAGGVVGLLCWIRL